MGCCILFLGERSAVCVTPLGEDTWEIVPGVSADFNLYLFTVVNHTVVYVSSMNPSTELSKLRVVLGTLHRILIPVRRAMPVLTFTACVPNDHQQLAPTHIMW